MQKSMTPWIVSLVVVLVAVFNGFFIINETEQVLVLQFGKPVRVISTPGLKAKVPFMQDVKRFEKRVLDLDPPTEPGVILGDRKRLDVDAYVRFRITDVLKFYQSVQEERDARTRLSDIVNSSIREALGNETLDTVLSTQRSQIMLHIRDEVNEKVAGLGIRIVDVRIRQADYPEPIVDSVFNLMRSERIREAKTLRAEGFEDAQRIRADADKQRIVILAEAQKEAQVTRGEGDSDAIKLYGSAFGKDPSFYSFYRSLEAYRKSMANEDTTLVLSPDSPFFKYFK